MDGPEPWASDMQMPRGPPTVFGPSHVEPPLQSSEPALRTSKRRVQKNTTAIRQEPRSPERRKSPAPTEEKRTPDQAPAKKGRVDPPSASVDRQCDKEGTLKPSASVDRPFRDETDQPSAPVDRRPVSNKDRAFENMMIPYDSPQDVAFDNMMAPFDPEADVQMPDAIPESPWDGRLPPGPVSVPIRTWMWTCRLSRCPSTML